MTKTIALSPRTIAILSGSETTEQAIAKIPFLRTLRAAWPDAKTHWIAAQGDSVFATELRAVTKPFIDRVLLKHPESSSSPYDLVLDIRFSGAHALLARLQMKPKSFVAPAWSYLFSDKKPSKDPYDVKELRDDLLRLIETAYGAAPPPAGPYTPLPEDLERARRILPETHLYIGFVLPEQEDEREKMIRVAQLQVRRQRLPVFVLTPDQMPLYNRLRQALPEAIFPCQATDVWGQQDSFWHKASLTLPCTLATVGQDSPLLHLMKAIESRTLLWPQTDATPEIINDQLNALIAGTGRV